MAERILVSKISKTEWKAPLSRMQSAELTRSIKSSALQAKLRIGQPNDIYEQEADRVAEQVTRMPDPALQCRCPRCDEDEKEVLQTKKSSGQPSLTQGQDVPPIIQDVLRSPGQPLDSATRAFMEPRFGHDFSGVRIHTDAKAAESAREVNALAYTLESDMVFGKGQFSPDTNSGKMLLAHELAHVVQQIDLGSSKKFSLNNMRLPLIQRKTVCDEFGGNCQSVPEETWFDKPTTEMTKKTHFDSLHSSSPTKKKSKGEIDHHADVVFQEGANRLVVTIDSIPVAEIAVDSKKTPLEVQIDIDNSAARVTIRHHGDAALAPVVYQRASLDLSVSLREIDMREGIPDHTGPKEPPVPGETAKGTVDIVIAPPSSLRWPDDPIGEIPIITPLLPGALSEFEEKVRSNPSLINGIVLDPDNSAEVVGYRVFATAGVTRLVDREGNQVFLDEISLETPPVDPLDFFPTPGSAGKFGAGIIGRVGVKSLGKKAAVKGATVSLGVIARMRGVSRALIGRAARKGLVEAPSFVRRITKAGLDHSFDRHSVQWFGRVVSRETHFTAWSKLIERVSASKLIFPWSVGASKTIGHLGRVEGKYFVVQFFEETGELATAFVPNSTQLREMLKLLKGAL
jgi:hypothetical protein